MLAAEKDAELFCRLEGSGIWLTTPDVRTLRRAQCTLQAWRTAECNGDIRRTCREDDPFVKGVCYRRSGRHSERWTPDREAGALRRVKAVCEKHGLHYFYQTDPRGCTLYVSKEPLNDVNYLRGVACSV